jgi:hypothetical protein
MSVPPETKPELLARQDKRYYAHFRELCIGYEGFTEEITLRPPDLSSRGMFIQTARHFSEGAVLKVRFRLARSGYEVNARAEVRYCLRGVGIGVEFIDIPPLDRQAIENELKDTDGPRNASPNPDPFPPLKRR